MAEHDEANPSICIKFQCAAEDLAEVGYAQAKYERLLHRHHTHRIIGLYIAILAIGVLIVLLSTAIAPYCIGFFVIGYALSQLVVWARYMFPLRRQYRIVGEMSQELRDRCRCQLEIDGMQVSCSSPLSSLTLAWKSVDYIEQTDDHIRFLSVYGVIQIPVRVFDSTQAVDEFLQLANQGLEKARQAQSAAPQR